MAPPDNPMSCNRCHDRSRGPMGLLRLLMLVVAMMLTVALVGGCSSGSDSAGRSGSDGDSEPAADSDSADAEDDDSAASGGSVSDGSSSDADDGDPDPDPADGDSPGEPEPTTAPTLDEDSAVLSVTELDAGQEVVDESGNLVVVHGIAEWPAAFDDLTGQVRQSFVFVDDLDELNVAETRLLAIDVGVCAAGRASDVASDEAANAEDGSGLPAVALPAFSLVSDALASVDAGASSPNVAVLEPGFVAPNAGACARGWLPFAWSETAEPARARAVTGEGQARHVYHWNIDGLLGGADEPLATEPGVDASLRVGQTASFGRGPLASSSVTVAGWAEVVGETTPIDGTRPVTVDVRLCSEEDAGGGVPDLALGVDGWTVVAPLDAEAGIGLVAAAELTGDADGCAQAWIDFAIPLGTVPTTFVVSDGTGTAVDRAAWTLTGGAVAAPE